ncbi:MAG: hypothetical protein KME52_00195 [Desmonostoc geniculatum HA4340-LM1]|jgi:hypothetical protein|nr:hypothetical protein [Desmonostoc geniculatum HA4340-LM1]
MIANGLAVAVSTSTVDDFLQENNGNWAWDMGYGALGIGHWEVWEAFL